MVIKFLGAFPLKMQIKLHFFYWYYISVKFVGKESE